MIALPLACLGLALLVLVGPGEIASAGPGKDGASEKAAKEEKRATVVLVIDFGDGFEKHYTALGHIEKMTVLDVLKAAAGHARALEVDSSGSGATAFVKGIDGVKNGEKAGGRDGFWQFSVNGRYGEASAGAVRVDAGDRVRWWFGEYREEKSDTAR